MKKPKYIHIILPIGLLVIIILLSLLLDRKKKKYYTKRELVTMTDKMVNHSDYIIKNIKEFDEKLKIYNTVFNKLHLNKRYNANPKTFKEINYIKQKLDEDLKLQERENYLKNWSEKLYRIEKSLINREAYLDRQRELFQKAVENIRKLLINLKNKGILFHRQEIELNNMKQELNYRFLELVERDKKIEAERELLHFKLKKLDHLESKEALLTLSKNELKRKESILIRKEELLDRKEAILNEYVRRFGDAVKEIEEGTVRVELNTDKILEEKERMLILKEAELKRKEELLKQKEFILKEYGKKFNSTIDYLNRIGGGPRPGSEESSDTGR